MTKKKENIPSMKQQASLLVPREQLKVQIRERIVKANDLLQVQVNVVQRFSGRQIVSEYETDGLQNFRREHDKWTDVTMEILRRAFDMPDNEYCTRFKDSENEIYADLYGNPDWLNIYKRHLKDQIAYLEGFVEQLQFIGESVTNQILQDDTVKSKTPKIFISHSSGDKEFVEALVDLLERMQFTSNEVFCSSVPGYWVKLKQNFCEVIKSQFTNHDLFLIYVHSPRLYASPISMNEMGAAWVLQNDYYSFLTIDMDYDKMKGVVDSREIAIKVNAETAKNRMNEFMENLCKLFGKPYDLCTWERKRDAFLKKVCEIQIEKEQIPSEIVLTETEISRMSRWVESGDNDLFQVWFEGGSATFGLGAANQYEVSGGKEMADWQDFFLRMEKSGYIRRNGVDKHNHNHPQFSLTSKAYERFSTK